MITPFRILLILIAGADFPPPIGFLWVVGLLIVLVVAGAFVLPRWWAQGERLGFARAVGVAAVQGALVGAVTAALSIVVSPGEPSVERDWVAALIFIVVLAVPGACVCAAVLAASWFFRPKPSVR